MFSIRKPKQPRPAKPVTAGFCLVLLCSLGLASPTSGLTPYGGWTVDSIEITGIDKQLADNVRDGLALNVRSGFLGLKKAKFQAKHLQEDLDRVRFFLARHGYPSAAVEPRLEAIGNKQRLRIIFEVMPGPAVTIGEVSTAGIPEKLNELAQLATAQLARDTRFTDDLVQQALALMTERLRAAGYAQAEVSLTLSHPDSTTVDLMILVDPGARFTFVSVSASGVRDDLATLAERTMGVEPGTRYSPRIVQDARDNLRELMLFKQIRVSPREAGPLNLDLYADLKPSPPRTLRFSVGSWSDETWRVAALWRHRNLFRSGRGGELAATVSEHQRMLGGGVWWPTLFSKRSRTDLRLEYEIEDEDSYYLTRGEIEIATRWRLAQRATLRMGVGLSEIDVDSRSDDPASIQDQTGRLTTFSANLYRDRSDELLYPNRGTRLTLEAEWSPPGILSQSPYWSLCGQEVVYVPLAADWVFAGRVKLGVAHPLGEAEDLLPNNRFYAGGVNTMRGYKRRELGPADAGGNPIGGEATLLAGCELRFPLWKFINGTVFLDSGQVWDYCEDVSVSDMQVAVGPGIMVRTPVGPVSLGVGRLLTAPPAGRSRMTYHLAIGYPY